MTRSSLAVLAFVAVPLALVCGVSLRADPPQNAGQGDSPFTGKIVVVNQRSNSTLGATLEDVHVRRIGDQTFLVGKGFAADEGKGWYNDRMIWVPVNDVSQVTEFEDRSDLLKARDSRRDTGR
jgi:hypothetical protein